MKTTWLDPHLLDNSAPIPSGFSKRREADYRARPEVKRRESANHRRWVSENAERVAAYKARWRAERRGAFLGKATWSRVSLDEPVKGIQRHELIGAVASSPEEELAANEVSGLLNDLDIDSVERMTPHALQGLQERLVEMGVRPRLVQQSERERLKVPEPHRGGSSPPPLTGKKSSRHRGRSGASAVMKHRGKKFKRRSKQPKDGWGGYI